VPGAAPLVLDLTDYDAVWRRIDQHDAVAGARVFQLAHGRDFALERVGEFEHLDVERKLLGDSCVDGYDRRITSTERRGDLLPLLIGEPGSHDRQLVERGVMSGEFRLHCLRVFGRTGDVQRAVYKQPTIGRRLRERLCFAGTAGLGFKRVVDLTLVARRAGQSILLLRRRLLFLRRR
jgi:hypothetical protein